MEAPNEILSNEFNAFLENTNAKMLGVNLRKLLVEVLQTKVKDSNYIDELLKDLESLFALLDAIEQYKKPPSPGFTKTLKEVVQAMNK